MIAFACIEVLRELKQCKTLSEVGARTDDWQERLDTYGGELRGATKTFRSLFLNIIPPELKAEILKEDALQNSDHVAHGMGQETCIDPSDRELGYGNQANSHCTDEQVGLSVIAYSRT